MRTNLPVTNVEYPIHDDTLIVSKTDLKGKLSYFNDQFVAAAGFTEAELKGQPHNIIRHPEMPSVRRAPPPSVSASCRRRRPASATSSS
jgi:hypothetical protein